MQLMNCTAEGFQPVDKLGGGVPDPKCHFPRPFLDTHVVSSKTIPDSKPKWAKSIPLSAPVYTRSQTRTAQKPYPLAGAAHMYMVYIRECPPHH